MSTVLLVDDEPGVLFTLSEVLTERGHRVDHRDARRADALTKLDDADAVAHRSVDAAAWTASS